MKTTSFRLRIIAQTLPFLLVAPGIALAQKAPTRHEAAAALNQPAEPGAQQFTRQQIDQLVAPIALYPDQLLSQVLMAASYPQQVVEAAQWVQDPSHTDLKGDALMAALEPLPWEPSVKALVPFPQILAMMSEHIEWTQALGVAFVTQQPEVMAQVQSLRHLAMKSGRLGKVKHLKVREEGQTIVITEAEPGRVFVPIYNPTVVYGAWPDQGFPPVFLPPPHGFVAETIEPGFEVSVGYTVVQPLWGWSRVDWRDRRITVERSEYTRITRDVEVGPGGVWRHRGPVLLVPPSEARTRVTTTTTTNIPSGTVAPARAAAVTVLPERAKTDPQRIRIQSTTERAGTERTGTERTQTTNRPGATQTERNQATSVQPGTTEAGKSGTGQPEQNRTGAAQPATTQPGQAESTKSQATPSRSAAEPGKTGPNGSEARTSPERRQGATQQSGTSEPAASRHERGEAAKSRTNQPGKSEATTATPTERQTRPESLRGNAAKGEGSTAAPAETRSREHPSAKTPSGATESPAAERERGALPSGSPQQAAPERGGSSMPGEAQQPGARGREHNGTAAAPSQREEHARPPQPGSGSSMPGEPQHRPGGGAEHSGGSTPPAAAAPRAAPSAQPAPEHGGGQPQGRSEEHGKKNQD